MGVWDMHSCTSPFLTVNVGMTSRELLNVIVLDELMFIGAERFWNIVGSVQVKLDQHNGDYNNFCLLFLKEKIIWIALRALNSVNVLNTHCFNSIDTICKQSVYIELILVCKKASFLQSNCTNLWP